MLLHNCRRAQAQKQFKPGQNHDEVVELANTDKKVRQQIGRHDNVREDAGDDELGAGGNSRVLDQAGKQFIETRQMSEQLKKFAPAELLRYCCRTECHLSV